MAKVDLRGVYAVKSKGRIYLYAWRGKGAPRLHSTPGSPDFIQELSEALASRTEASRGRMAWLCSSYKASPDFAALAPSTRRQWVIWIDRIQTHFGALSLRQFDRPIIRVSIRKWRDKWRDSPRTADYGLQVLSRVLAFGVAEGLLQANPCIGIPRLYSANRADLIWTDADIEKISAVASPEIALAVRLAALTGLRQGDLLRLSRSHIKGDAIEMTTGKSRHRRSVVIPIYGDLRALLDSIPQRPAATTLLTNSEGLPWRSGFGSSWNKAIRKTGLDLHFHDLRGTAATRFYRSGLTEREIAEIMGWSESRVERLLDRYVKRDEIIRDRIRRLDANASGTESAKLGAKR